MTDREIRIARHLVKLAKHLEAKGPATANGIAKMLYDSINDDNAGYAMELPSGRWLCCERGEENGRKYDNWFINSRVDMFNEPYGLLLEDLGSIEEGDTLDDCKRFAQYALQEDANFKYLENSIWPVTAEDFWKEYIKGKYYPYDLDISENGREQELVDRVNKIGGNVWDAIDKAIEEIYSEDEEDED